MIKKGAIRTRIALPSILLLCSTVTTAAHRYPTQHWDQTDSPEALGYSSEKLKQARGYSSTLDTAAVMVVVDGVVLDQWGVTTKKLNVHSIRKSLLSALYGIHVHAGNIDLSKTMAELGIDDNEPPLSGLEKSATVHQLLEARSGVYHRAVYESPWMKVQRPKRYSQGPGTFWYYNNWDFNVLGTIFRKLTGTDIFQEFERAIAEPIGMEDFRPADGYYVSGPDSIHPAYPFRMTARDLARFGLLYLRDGRWEEKQIIPPQWVQASVTPYSNAGPSGGYGYMWWVATHGKHLPDVTLEDGSFSARGAGGHFLLVLPSFDMVVVHRVDTDTPGNMVTSGEFGKLVKMILEAKI